MGRAGEWDVAIEIELDALAGYVTVAHAARVLRVTPNAIYKRLARERIPALRVGRQWMVRLDDLKGAKQ
jgi:excisionase family DNA binding protein